MLISVFVSGLAAIGVIWLFSVVFARYQLRQIMRPVNALTAGAKRVEQGDVHAGGLSGPGRVYLGVRRL